MCRWLMISCARYFCGNFRVCFCIVVSDKVYVVALFESEMIVDAIVL